MFKSCPGSSMFKNLSIEVQTCPYCGNEVEFFSDEMEVVCDNCGKKVKRILDKNLCINYCKYAKECLGEDMLKKLKGE